MVPSSLLASTPLMGEKRAARERTRVSFRGLLSRDFSRLPQMIWVKSSTRHHLSGSSDGTNFLARESEIKLKYFVRMNFTLSDQLHWGI